VDAPWLAPVFLLFWRPKRGVYPNAAFGHRLSFEKRSFRFAAHPAACYLMQIDWCWNPSQVNLHEVSLCLQYPPLS
jgi:hypothetical protein